MDKEKLLNLIDDGLSQRGLADALNCSQTTIRYWLKKYGISTNNATYNQKYPTDTQKSHKVSYVKNRRDSMMKKVLEYKGGCCTLCGYNRCQRALEFHHLNEDDKSFNISRGYSMTWSKLKQEADKCVLLCANCHREVHAGILNIGE